MVAGKFRWESVAFGSIHQPILAISVSLLVSTPGCIVDAFGPVFFTAPKSPMPHAALSSPIQPFLSRIQVRNCFADLARIEQSYRNNGPNAAQYQP